MTARARRVAEAGRQLDGCLPAELAAHCRLADLTDGRLVLAAAGALGALAAFVLTIEKFRVLEDPTYVPAWLRMAGLVDDMDQQRECLERALTLDPNCAPARR